MKREGKTFKFCAKVAEKDFYIIENAYRFEGYEKSIHAMYYNVWEDAYTDVIIYEATSEEDFKRVLNIISQFYTNNPDGVLDFTLL